MKLRSSLLGVALATIVASGAFASVANAAELPQVKRDSFQTEIKSADKPVVLVVTGDSSSCASCQATEDLLVDQATKHPELKIVKVDAKEFNVDASTLPAVYVFVPGLDRPPFHQDNFAPTAATIDAFMNQRAAFATKEAAAAATLKSAQDQQKQLGKPADDKMADLQKQADTAQTAYQAASDQVRKDWETASAPLNKQLKTATAPYDKRIAALEHRIQLIEKQKAAAAKPTQTKLDDAMKPFQGRLDDARKQFQATMTDLRKQAGTIQQEHDKLVAPAQGALDSAQQALQDIVKQDQAAAKAGN